MSDLSRKIRFGIAAGAAGSIANSLAIEAVKACGLKPGTGGLGRLVFGRELTRLNAEIFHFGMGVAMAATYVIFIRDHLRGPGWLRGLMYAQIPGALQLFWVLPATGKGIAGKRVSPSTPVLAWSLNALFGVVLGGLACPDSRADG